MILQSNNSSARIRNNVKLEKRLLNNNYTKKEESENRIEIIGNKNSESKVNLNNYASYVSFGMNNLILKKALRSPLTPLLKPIQPLWGELNHLGLNERIKNIEPMFHKNLARFWEREKNCDVLFNETGKKINLAETEDRYDMFYTTQHARWENFFVNNKNIDQENNHPNDIIEKQIMDFRNKLPEEFEKNKETLSKIESKNGEDNEIKKQAARIKKLIKLQNDYLTVMNDDNLIIDREALKISISQSIIKGLRNKNFIVFKHNINNFENALYKFLNYTIIAPPNIIEEKENEGSNTKKDLIAIKKMLGMKIGKPTFSQCLKRAFLEEIYDTTLPIFPITDSQSKETGILTLIPKTSKDDPNYLRRVDLMRYYSHSNWCTKFKSAKSYLQESDFYCYIPYEGGRKICMVVKDGDIHSLESAENNHLIEEADYPILKSIFRSCPEVEEIIEKNGKTELIKMVKEAKN